MIQKGTCPRNFHDFCRIRSNNLINAHFHGHPCKFPICIVTFSTCSIMCFYLTWNMCMCHILGCSALKDFSQTFLISQLDLKLYVYIQYIQFVYIFSLSLSLYSSLQVSISHLLVRSQDRALSISLNCLYTKSPNQQNFMKHF